MKSFELKSLRLIREDLFSDNFSYIKSRKRNDILEIVPENYEKMIENRNFLRLKT